MRTEETGFGLTIQELAQVVDRVLVLGEIAGQRGQRGWFNPSDVMHLFETFRVPRPADIANNLLAAEKRGFTVRRPKLPKWSLTPLGRKRVHELVGSIDLTKLSPEMTGVAGAEFGDGFHSVLPPTLAPVQWSAGIARMLRRFPFERNVFCMTRLPDKTDPSDELHGAIARCREVLDQHGLQLHLATDRVFDDALLGNVAAYIWACKYGLGIAEKRQDETLNYNMLAEVGAMEIAGRRCALLKDTTVKSLPTDLVGQIYKSVDLQDLTGVGAAVHGWAAEDLGLGRCSRCPSTQI